MSETSAIVKENLRAFGMDADVKAQTMHHLCRVWENKATIASVARQSHVARQTFYNNPLLTEYVNAWLKEYAVENPFDTIERLREALRDETEKVRKMVARDADVSKYKAMVVDLKDEVAALKKTVATQSDTIAMMRRTNFAVSDGKKK